MKTSKFLFLLVFLFLVFGCTKDSAGDPGIDKSANFKPIGYSAHDLLSGDKFTSINVEIVYVIGFKPSEATLANLKQFLQSRIYKPDGITITSREVPSSTEAPFSISEVKEIEKRERRSYNAGNEISVYIYFADGSDEADINSDEVWGYAYRNTSIVIFGKTVNQVTENRNLTNRSIVETATLEHDFGHMFGLVNGDTPMLTPHEDPESKSHCIVLGCVMYRGIQLANGLNNDTSYNPLKPLDDLCLADLRANGGK